MKRSNWRDRLILCFALSAGCLKSSTPTPRPLSAHAILGSGNNSSEQSAAHAPGTLTPGWVHRIALDLERIRGAKIGHEPGIEVVDNLNSELPQTNESKALQKGSEMLIGFGVAKEGGERYDLAVPLLARFNVNREHVEIRRSVASSYSPTGLYLIVSHELEHAAQSRFGDLAANSSIDSAMARLALLEGDAEFSEAALWSSLRHKSIGDAFVHSSDFFKASFGNGIPQTHAQSVYVFSYLDGALFLLSLYNEGGFTSVDAALTSPPETTAQILHTDKYRRRSPAKSVSVPLLPPEFTIVGTSSMGEFLLSEVIASCELPSVARELADGWAGDSLSVGRDSSGRYAFAWTVMWDSESGASRFEGELASSNCLSTLADTGKIEWEREGPTLAMTRGLDLTTANSLRKRMLMRNRRDGREAGAVD